jgi:hypothetical protein
MPTKPKTGKLKVERVKNLRGRPLQQTQLVLSPASEIPVTLDRSFELVRTVITAAVSDVANHPSFWRLTSFVRSATSLGSGRFLRGVHRSFLIASAEMCSLMSATKFSTTILPTPIVHTMPSWKELAPWIRNQEISLGVSLLEAPMAA